MADVVVVGGGVGGMAAALRIACDGHRVRLYERREELGGKLAEIRRDGFAFGIGPSLLTLPEVFADLARVAGRRLADLVDLTPVDPICRYRFAGDGGVLDAAADPEAMADAVDRLAPGQGRAWRDFYAWGRDCWEAGRRTFFTAGFAAARAAPASAAVRAGDPRDLFATAPGRTLAGHAARFFSDPRLRQYACRYATYAGSSPYRAPAALGCVPYLEHAHGGWYVRGGLIRLRDMLAGLLTQVGVEVRTGAEVTRVLTAGRRATGVALAGGERVRADAVVVNADAARLYGTLLPDRRRMRRIRRLGPSSSGLLILARVRGRTAGLAHHNVCFSADYRAEFTDIFVRRRPPADPTVYVGCSGVDDPGQAPPGDENWTVLVNVPAGDPAGWPTTPERYAEHVLTLLAGHGLDLSGRLAGYDLLTPADLARRYDAWRGSIYGTAYNGRLSALRRPGNRGPYQGLYLAGGSAHPGGGLPLVAMGAAIVAELVRVDLADLARAR